MGIIEKGGHLITTRRQKYCVVCGAPLLKKQRSYCSKECYKEALRRVEHNERKFMNEKRHHI